jgi:hypothetical protein
MTSLEQRFWSKVEIREPDVCWLWTASVNNRGYGRFWITGQIVLAHRVSFKLHKGSLDPNLNVLHSCDERRCQNPTHLFQGTQLDNIHDMVAKGRHRGWNARFA